MLLTSSEEEIPSRAREGAQIYGPAFWRTKKREPRALRRPEVHPSTALLVGRAHPVDDVEDAADAFSFAREHLILRARGANYGTSSGKEESKHFFPLQQSALMR